MRGVLPLVIIVCLFLTACGQKGPLMLVEESDVFVGQSSAGDTSKDLNETEKKDSTQPVNRNQPAVIETDAANQ